MDDGRSMRAGKDSLAIPLMTKWENRKTLARAYGTSRRASGWVGENVARSGELIRAIIGKRTRASLEDHFGHSLRPCLGQSTSLG
jgi:hypothetical protein